MGASEPRVAKKSSMQPQAKNKQDCKILFPNGNKYVGEVKEGQMDGHGVMTYRNGDVYKGEWRKNQQNGFGTYIYSKDQKKYVGYWQDNLYNGEGTIYYPDGSYYSGKFLEGEKHGKGCYVDAQGDDFEEEWKNGEVQVRLLRISSKNDDRTPKLKQKNDPFREEDDEDHEHDNDNDHDQDHDNLLVSRRERSSLKSLDENTGDKKKNLEKKKIQSKKDDDMMEEKDDKKLHSGVLFKSLGDFESGEGRAYDVGLDTLNIIEHIDMLNSAAGTLLTKNINEWNIDDVGDWLRHLGLDEYIEAFKKNHIDGPLLFDITETELKDDFKMMSVGHRKNFMKAIGNLKKIFCGHSGKNSEYIRQKIHKFYEKNKQRNSKIGIFNSLGNTEGKFYSQRFFTKNLYSENHQIIEEDDEHSNKYETNPSPSICAKNDGEHIESIVLSERQKTINNNESGSEDKEKSHPEFEIDEDILAIRSKGASKDELGRRAKENDFPKLMVDVKQPYGKQNSDRVDQKILVTKQSSEGKANSPTKRGDTVSDKPPSAEDGSKESNLQQQQQNPLQQQNSKNEKTFLGSEISSSSTSSDSDSSDEENKKKLEDKAKEEVVAVNDLAIPKVSKVEPKNEKRIQKKNTGANASSFKSAEFTTKAKQNPYKDGQKVKKRHRHYKKGDLEDLNQKIKDDIIRKFRESGLNENFIINYNELFFEKKIGEGGYGRVYLGKFSGIEVAIKEYGKRKLDTRRAEDFVKEVEVISNLRHPNIVLYMGACIHNGKYLMITEYLEEGSLFDHLHKKHTKINDDVMFNIIEDIALGMCYLHGRKVLHCDLKSSNILIDSSWGVKLCDFGLSRVKYKSDRKRFTKQRVGTPHWMAPEILRGEKYDEAADVYSFGMIIWEMVVGDIPYCNTPIKDIIETVGHQGKQIPLPTKGSPLILSIMKSCLGLEKNSRPTFKEIVGQLQQRNNKGTGPQKKNELFNFFGS